MIKSKHPSRMMKLSNGLLGLSETSIEQRVATEDVQGGFLSRGPGS